MLAERYPGKQAVQLGTMAVNAEAWNPLKEGRETLTLNKKSGDCLEVDPVPFLHTSGGLDLSLWPKKAF